MPKKKLKTLKKKIIKKTTPKKIVKVLAKPAKKPLAKKVKISFARPSRSEAKPLMSPFKGTTFSPKVEHKIHLKKIEEHVKAIQKEILPIAAPVSHLNLNPHLKQRTFLFISVAVVSIFAAVSIFAFLNNPKNPNLNQVSAVEEVPAIPATVSDGEPVSLIATGDLMFARYVELKMRNNKDYTWPVLDTVDFLKSADITFGNMESPLLPGRNTPTDSMTFRADLKSTEALKAAGFDVVSVANNHTMNYQIPGLTSTLQALQKAEIKYVGGGKDLETAYAPTILEVKGKKVAFLAYNDSSIPPKFHGEATKNLPGIAPMDTEAMKKHVAAAKLQADFVVVSMHAGKEYVKEPSQLQKDFAHAAIDAGASIVLGSHPHVVQGIEYYGNGVIFYSLGNFIFDQFFSLDVQTGLVVRLNLVKGEVPGVELFPVFIDKTQPRLLEGAEREAALKRLGLL